MDKNSLYNTIDQMKNLVELHLHLDGALSVNNCKELARLQNISIPLDDKEISELLRVSKDCHTLDELLKKFDFPLSLLQTEVGITTAIRNLLNELYEQGIIYAEIRFAPQLSTKRGLTQEQVVLAAIDGLKGSKIKSNLILCCMRGKDNYSENMETVILAKKYLGRGICAIDLSGSESMYPTKYFKDIFTYAKVLSIPFTIHAGEADGAESVKSAIDFGAKRIGHGVRVSEDLELVKLLARDKIVLEICPTSNLCTGVYNKISELPLKQFAKEGVIMTINTDDPVICNTNLKNELKLLVSAFGLSYDDIIRLQINAINSSFASIDVKNEIIKAIIK